jgi:hypothetical protein
MLMNLALRIAVVLFNLSFNDLLSRLSEPRSQGEVTDIEPGRLILQQPHVVVLQQEPVDRLTENTGRKWPELKLQFFR